MKQKILLLAMLCIVHSCFMAECDADTIHYGNLESPGMSFQQISEISVFDELPLFNAPQVNGNTLIFANPTFVASAAAMQLDFVDGRMTFNVSSKNGVDITGIRLQETGSFFNVGTDLDSSVSAIAFAVADGKIYQSTFQQNRQNSADEKWEDELFIQFDAPVSSFSFVVDNQMFARAGLNSNSLVDKDDVRITVTTIPEPASPAILFTTFALAYVPGRRRTS